jgi:hypothetical protein
MVPFPLIVYGHRKDQLKYLSGGPSAKLMYTAYFIMRVLRIMCSAETRKKTMEGKFNKVGLIFYYYYFDK